MRPSAPVLVVGAGLAGLAASLALAQRGFEVRLRERAGSLDEVGAGLQLSPNAMRALDRLGLLAALRARAVEARLVSLRDLRTGRLLARVPVRGGDGTPYLSIRRADLQRVLVEAVGRSPSIALELGAELTRIERTRDGVLAAFRRADGGTGTIEAPVAIAADGVRSAAAAALGHPPARPSGDVAWRLTLPAGDFAPAGIEAWLGASCHAVAYPVDAGRAVNLVLIAPETVADPRDAMLTGDSRLRAMADAACSATRWPLATADRPRLAGDPPGLLLVGDAAHAMLPYAAQGAALAIEDGLVAAACLSDADGAGQAWHRFEALRRPRWEKVRRRVAFHRFVYHLAPPSALARNLVMRLRGEASLAADLAWLYDWRPPDA